LNAAFKIVPPADTGEKWTLVLDMQPSDVQMTGG